MVAPTGFPWSFRAVSVATRERAYFAAGHDPSTARDIPVSFFFRWTGSWVSKPFAINATGICILSEPELHALMMGVDGSIVRATAKGFTEEQVDISDQGPGDVGDLQEIRRIGSRAYIVGMRRMAYRCDGPATWVRIDQGLRCDRNDVTGAGLNSIHGWGESELYAVGWEGEIWKFDRTIWRKIDSPTNLSLFRVVCGGDGKVYACGQRGTLLVGENDQWQVILHDATAHDFWGATWFRQHLYLSTANGLFRLINGSVEPIYPRSDPGLVIEDDDCFYRLDANDGVMWSIGEKMAIYTTDGVNWSETPYS